MDEKQTEKLFNVVTKREQHWMNKKLRAVVLIESSKSLD